MADAMRQSSVLESSSFRPRGLTNTTCALNCPRHRAINASSSPRLARVHGQCGCANMISVGRFASGTMRLWAGQYCGIEPERPGSFEYRAISARAATIEESQIAAVAVVITEVLPGN